MRVAAQEAIGGTPHDVVAARSSGSSSAGGFFALLAVLQNGGEVASSATGSEPTTATEVDGSSSDEGTGEGGEEALAASQGVVVTLSAASAATTVATQPVIDGGATPSTGETAGNGTGATSSAVIALLTNGSSAGDGSGSAAPATEASAEGPVPGAATTALDGRSSDAAATASPGTTRTAELAAVSLGRGVGARAAARGAHGATSANGTSETEHGAPPSATTQATAGPASSARTTAAAGGATGEPEVTRAIGHDAGRAASTVHAEPGRREDDIDDGDADEVTVADGFAAARPTSAQAGTREIPASARSFADTLQPLGQAHGQHAADANARPDAFGIARSEATTASGAADGTTRLRASGFTSGDATLPSWVERLASPEGLGASRRGTLHLDLEPDGLGRIEVRLSFGRDGVRAAVVAEHEHTRTLLASQQPQLAAALERNDLRLESFLVDVGSQSGGDGREAWRDATDPAAFDQIGLLHASEPDATSDAPAPVAGRGLVNVRA